jgi:CheY-like chemotaxis protein
MEEYYRNHLIGVFIESDLTALQILAQNKEVLLDPEMSDYTRRDVIKKILSLPPEVSAEGIAMTAAVLSANSAFLFPSEMEGEDRARIIEAAFQCSADKLNARLIALEENTGTLLKDMKGRDHTGMVITGLGVEAEEIVSRAAAIERNKGVYFPEETEGANRVIAALLNTDASKIEALAPRVAELLPGKMRSYTHVNVILALLNADFDRVPELIKYKGLLFKAASGWNIERIIESALKLNAEELSRRVVAIEKVLLPDSVLSRLVGGRYFEHIYEEIVLALLKKSVEETDAFIMAFERNAATFLTTPFTKSLQDQYDSVRIVRELIKLSAEEINNRAEIINRHAKVLFPAEISDDHKVQIMQAVVAISGDKLDAAVPKIAEAYARVEKSADSDARARVIIDNLPRYYDW